MKNYDAIPQIDWARLAAYIDGEGCLSIARGHIKKDHICHVYDGRNFLGGTPRFGGVEMDEKRDAYRNELKRLKRVFPPQDIERIQEIIQ